MQPFFSEGFSAFWGKRKKGIAFSEKVWYTESILPEDQQKRKGELL